MTTPVVDTPLDESLFGAIQCDTILVDNIDQHIEPCPEEATTHYQFGCRTCLRNPEWAFGCDEHYWAATMGYVACRICEEKKINSSIYVLREG